MVKMNKTVGKKVYAFCLLVFFLVFLAAFLAFSFWEKNRIYKEYSSGKQCYEHGEYQEAVLYLEGLGDYKDAVFLVNDSKLNIKYSEAVDYYDNGIYEKALELFTELGNFKDSQDYAIKCQFPKVSILQQQTYQQALDEFENRNFRNAKEIFVRLSGYKDSNEWVKKCNNYLTRLELSSPICAGIRATVGITEDGDVQIVGDFDPSKVEFSSWKDIVSVSGRGEFYIGLSLDGKVFTTGKFGNYDINVNEKKEWNNEFVAVAAGEQYVVGLTVDGKVCLAGRTYDGQDECLKWKDIVYIASGRRHIVGIDKYGTVHIAGKDSEKQMEIISQNADDWQGVVSVDAGGDGVNCGVYTVGLRSDGKIVFASTGGARNIEEQLKSLEDQQFFAVSAGDTHVAALSRNEEVVMIGDSGILDYQGKQDDEIYQNWNNVKYISAGTRYTVAISYDGKKKKVLGAGNDHQHQLDAVNWNSIFLYAP